MVDQAPANLGPLVHDLGHVGRARILVTFLVGWLAGDVMLAAAIGVDQTWLRITCAVLGAAFILLPVLELGPTAAIHRKGLRYRNTFSTSHAVLWRDVERLQTRSHPRRMRYYLVLRDGRRLKVDRLSLAPVLGREQPDLHLVSQAFRDWGHTNLGGLTPRSLH